MKGQVIYGSVDLTDAPYFLSPQTNLGAPTADVTTVSRLLTDGDIVAGVRSGNRTLTLTVVIAANSRSDFAAAEAALFAELDKPANTLTVMFGQGEGAQVVADTFRGQITPTFDAELDLAYMRRYDLAIPAAPFFRSPQPVTISPTVTSVLLDSFDSLTGLTTSSTPTLDTTTFVEGTASVRQLFAVGGPDLQQLTASWQRSVTSTDLTGCTAVGVRLLPEHDVPYSSWGGGSGLALIDGSGRVGRVSSNAVVGAAWSTLAFDLAPLIEFDRVDLSDIVRWELDVSQFIPVGSVALPGMQIWADNLAGYFPGSGEYVDGSANLTFLVGGAARTPLSIEVDGANFGGVLISTTPNPPPDYDPILAPVSTLTAVSGSSVSFTRKAVTLQRQDSCTYQIVIYGKPESGGGGFTFTATATVGSDPTAVIASCSRTFTATDPEVLAANDAGYSLFSIGEITLPPVGVDPQNTAADVTITIDGPSSFGTFISAIWLVWAGADTVAVFLPGSSSVNNLYLDAPAPTQQVGSLKGGSARSSAFDLGAARVGQVIVNAEPGLNHVLVAGIPYATAPTVPPGVTSTTATYYPRWLTEATA